jgi:hypothetical protein
LEGRHEPTIVRGGWDVERLVGHDQDAEMGGKNEVELGFELYGASRLARGGVPREGNKRHDGTLLGF